MSSCVIATENSKTMVVPTILKGNNYLLWSRTTKAAIGGKRLWKHVLEKECPKKTLKMKKKKKKEGEEDLSQEEIEEALKEEEEKWEEDQQAVLSLLQASLDPAILEAYSYCESPKDLWETLKGVYGNTSNLSRIFEIKKDINDLHQDGMEFTKHLGRFQTLWSELEMLRPLSVDPKVLNERREQDKVFGLLLTLDPRYNEFIKHILRDDKLPTLEEVCAKVQKEQGNIGLFGGKSELVTANKAGYKHDKKSSKVCEHCKKEGHSKEKCWSLHPHLKPDFPSSRKPRTNAFHGDNSRQANRFQYSCGHLRSCSIV